MSSATGTGGWLGKSLPRIEDSRLTHGLGEYFADVPMTDALHLWFVRSTHSHANITSIDTSGAEAMEGVVDVITGEELARGMKSLPIPTVLPSFEARYPTYWALATGKVRWHGEPVAAVIATNKYPRRRRRRGGRRRVRAVASGSRSRGRTGARRTQTQ